MDQVPRDVLALLPPRTAPSPCRAASAGSLDVVDARCHLRADLLPVSVAGIFMMTNEAEPPEFFVRPSMVRKIAGDLQSYPKTDKDHHGHSLAGISDCCNGLMLLEDHVVNPSTRQWTRLPPYPTTLPEEEQSYYDFWYLVFDPTLSPHFEVFSMKSPLDHKHESSEWPQLGYMLVRIYSSSTLRWEERPFLREEEEHTAAAANVWSKLYCGCWHAVYRHGSLCVLDVNFHYKDKCVHYQVINLPPDINSTRYHQFRLGKSVNGVHFAVAGLQGLQVWFLDESGSKTEWVLKHVSGHSFSHDQTDRPWILRHGPYAYDDDDQEENNREPTATDKH